MKCAEYLLDHPTNVQSLCFEHMCDDLDSANVIKRIDRNIEILNLAKSELLGNAAEAKPKSIWQRLEQSLMSLKPSKWANLSFEAMPVLKHLMLLLLIAVFLFMSVDQSMSSPYESTSWFLLQTLGQMIE